MDIREKIAARNAERKNDEELKRGLWRMAGIILTGYAIGTVIALILLALRG